MVSARSGAAATRIPRAAATARTFPAFPVLLPMDVMIFGLS